MVHPYVDQAVTALNTALLNKDIFYEELHGVSFVVGELKDLDATIQADTELEHGTFGDFINEAEKVALQEVQALFGALRASA